MDSTTYNSSKKLKAKPDKWLDEHTNKSLNVLFKIKPFKEPLVKKLSQQLRFSEEKFWEHTFLMVFFHDFGKGTESFQRKMNAPTVEDRKRIKAYPHALASVPFIKKAVENDPLLEKPFYPEVLAVATHHSDFHPRLFDRLDGKNPHYIFEPLKEFHAHLSRLFKGFTKQPLSRSIEFPSGEDVENPYILFCEAFGETMKYIADANSGNAPLLRDLFALLKGLLWYADWISSGKQYDDYCYSINDFSQQLEDGVKRRKPGFKGWEGFQRQAASSQGDTFIQIPTGLGKTEAALLWANSLNKGNKIIYLLPTMVTVNKMWERLREYFGEENVGIAHGAVGYYLSKEMEEKGEDVNYDELYLNKILLGKTFMKPITVSTVDQLLYSFFNWGHWELVNANASNSLIIFDEIHIYDSYTLGLILKTMEYLKNYGVRFAFMSATFPKMLENNLKSYLKDEAFTIAEPIFDKLKRHKIELIDKHLEDALPQIVQDFKVAKRVLVICNTVNRSKEIYQMIKEELGVKGWDKERYLLFHSQFTLKDRAEREKLLEQAKSRGGYIAVATQVVEVSLDIDFDVLYSEMAPPDALVQRLGRVNRGKKNSKPAEVYIHRETEKSHSIYSEALLGHAWKFIKESRGYPEIDEAEWREIVNRAYDLPEIAKELTEDLREGLESFDYFFRHLSYVYSLKLSEERITARTRKESYPSIEVVPACFKSTVEGISKENAWKRAEYAVRVPFFAIKDFLDFPRNSEFFLSFANVKYDEEIGVIYEREHVGDNLV